MIRPELWKTTWPSFWEGIEARSEEWRKFLLGESKPSGTIHIFVASHGMMALPRELPGFQEYLLRFSDATLAGGKRRCYAFAKFAHFVVFGSMAGLPFDETFLENTAIGPQGGRLSYDQWIGDMDFSGMLLGRVEALNQARASVGLPSL